MVEREEIDLQKLHKDIPPQERDKWKDKGATEGTDGVWRKDNRVVAPECIQNTLLNLHHGLPHTGRDAMIRSLGREWWWKGMGRDVAIHCRKCIICAQHNPGKPIKVRMKHQPRPKGPWEQIQMDFIGPLPPSHGKLYCLVIIDQFTRWVEVFPTTNCTATTVAKILAAEVIPRWGMPIQIDSDQGTHFTGKVLKDICRLLGVRQKFHIPYHPQSSGMVERMNRTLKTNLAKAVQSSGKNWTDMLPAVLMRLRATTNRTTGLTPYELMTGRAMQLPENIITGGADVGPIKDKVRQYIKNLSTQLKGMRQTVTSNQAQVDAGDDPEIRPEVPEAGSRVLTKVLPAKPGFAPRWHGPYEVIISGDTCACIDIRGQGTWKHWSQLKPYQDK